MIHDVRTELRWFTTRSMSTWHVLIPGDRAACRANIRPYSQTYSDAQQCAYPLPIPKCLPCLRKLAERDAECERTAQAEKLGREAGIAAASWVFDGSADTETYRRVLQGIEDGDPEVMDAYRVPGLSAEFADEYTLSDLAHDLDVLSTDDALDDYANAFEDAASDAFWAELERVADAHLYPVRAYVCPCCAESVMDSGQVCGECRTAECESNDKGDFNDCQRPCPLCGDPRTSDVYVCVIYERSDGETDYADGYLCEDHVPDEPDVPGTLIPSAATVLEYEVRPLDVRP